MQTKKYPNIPPHRSRRRIWVWRGKCSICDFSYSFFISLLTRSSWEEVIWWTPWMPEQTTLKSLLLFLGIPRSSGLGKNSLFCRWRHRHVPGKDLCYDWYLEIPFPPAKGILPNEGRSFWESSLKCMIYFSPGNLISPIPYMLLVLSYL